MFNEINKNMRKLECLSVNRYVYVLKSMCRQKNSCIKSKLAYYYFITNIVLAELY